MTKTTIYRHLPHTLRHLAMACCLLPFFASCIDEDEMPDTPSGNLEALWHIIDEHYCFLD